MNVSVRYMYVCMVARRLLVLIVSMLSPYLIVVQSFDLLQHADYVHCMAYDSNGLMLTYCNVCMHVYM